MRSPGDLFWACAAPGRIISYYGKETVLVLLKIDPKNLDINMVKETLGRLKRNR